MTDLIGVGAVYVLIAVGLAAAGIVEYVSRDGDKQSGARMLLSAPVWPLAFVFMLVRVWLPRLWRDAFTRDKKL